METSGLPALASIDLTGRQEGLLDGSQIRASLQYAKIHLRTRARMASGSQRLDKESVNTTEEETELPNTDTFKMIRTASAAIRRFVQLLVFRALCGLAQDAD
jgi:hypothetical protein